eukprot:189979_1
MTSKKDVNQKGSNLKYATITRAELAGGYFGKHVVFVIKTPSGCEIKRRYTDFEWLRHSLCQMYPGAFIPPIPPKLAVSMWPQGYLLMRKRELQQFLQRLEVIPYLRKEDQTLFFLSKHKTNSFDKQRKTWEKQHETPSTRQIYDNLITTFPKIHETKTPGDMETRCKLSTQLIDESIKQFEIMAKSCDNFVDRTKQCCEAISEFRNSFEDLLRVEYDETQTQYITQKRIDICLHFEQWKSYKMDEINNMNIYYVPTIHRALNDLGVIKEILMTRDKIRLDYKVAKKAADVWNDSTKSIKSSQLAKKHKQIQM